MGLAWTLLSPVFTRVTRTQGFTLIELMIVVAIVGVLAAIAIPNFLKFQMRSKAGEGKVNLSAIRTAEEAYFAEIGTYLAWPLSPAAAPTSQKRAWAPCPNVPPQAGDPGHCFIGWEPEGDVYYSYIVATDAPPPSSQFFAVGESDIDGDGNLNLWGYQKPNAGGQFTIGATQGCNTVLNLEQSITAGANVAMTQQVPPVTVRSSASRSSERSSTYPLLLCPCMHGRAVQAPTSNRRHVCTW